MNEGKSLSNAGNEVLIKSIVQQIPTFVTICFKLPFELCKDLIQEWWIHFGVVRRQMKEEFIGLDGLKFAII